MGKAWSLPITLANIAGRSKRCRRQILPLTSKECCHKYCHSQARNVATHIATRKQGISQNIGMPHKSFHFQAVSPFVWLFNFERRKEKIRIIMFEIIENYQLHHDDHNHDRRDCNDDDHSSRSSH